MPERFGLTYTAADDTKHTPVMIHRALLGSIERFLGILIEHYAGDFPVWLAPIQARVLPIADRHNDYAERVERELRAAGVRVATDERAESVGRKIRDAELAKIPFMRVVGDNEQEGAGVSVRRHGEGDLGLMPLQGAVDRIRSEFR
jgi:threonyl-tRNA synthetase